MAITHLANDASASNSSTSSFPITVTSSTAGSLMVVCAQWLSNAMTVTAAGNASGAFTSGVGPVDNGTGCRYQMWFKQNSTGGDTTITLTVTGGPASIRAQYMEFTGAATSGGTDGTSTNTGSTTSVDCGAITTAGSNDVIIAGAGFTGTAAAFTPGTGYTDNTSLQNRINTEWQVFSSAQSGHHPTFTTQFAATWSDGALAFQAAGGGTNPWGWHQPDEEQPRLCLAQGQGPLGLADEWLPLVPKPPLFEWDESERWQLNRDARVNWGTGEIDTGLLPIVPTIIYDDDPSRTFDARQQQDDEPWHTFFTIPTPPPTLGWDDWDWSRDFSPVYFKSPEAEPFDFTRPIVTPLAYDESATFFPGSSGSLAAMVMMDEFVNAPAGSIPFGPAPSGRSVRFGFSISAFR